MHPLRSSLLKVNRSLEHLHALNAARDLVFKEDPKGTFALVGEPDSHGTKYLFRAKMLQELPLLEWGVYVGDAVHCLRSALDQMIWSLAEKPIGSTAFPICLMKKEWVIDAPAQLWSVPEFVQAIVHDAQPYHRGDSAHSHPLAVLRTLSNLDKHRTIPVAALTPVSVRATVRPVQGIASCGELKIRRGVALEDDAVLADVAFKPDDSGLEPKMDMDSHFLFEMAFGRGGIPSSVQLKPVVQLFSEELGTSVLKPIVEVSAALGYAFDDPEIIQALSYNFPSK